MSYKDLTKLAIDNTERAPLEDEELYLENPQVAKTEDLLKFLPMVIRKLNAYPSDLVTNEETKKISKQTKNKQKGKNAKNRKRAMEKNETKKNEQPNKQVKTTEEPLEEEKETKEEKYPENQDDQNANIESPEDLASVSKPPFDSIDGEISEVKRTNLNNQNKSDKPCLSIKSNDHLIEHFPEDPFQKADDEQYHSKNSCNFNFSRANHSRNPSFDLSNNNYSDQCKDLEQRLLNECDMVIEELDREIHQRGRC